MDEKFKARYKIHSNKSIHEELTITHKFLAIK